MFNGSAGLNVGQSEGVFSKSGFKNWKQSTARFNIHQGSKCHLNSTTSLKTATNTNLKPIDTILDEQRKDILSQKEVKRLQNREIMKKLIDIVLCLEIGGKPFRGHTEKSNDVHKGLFLDVVRLLRKYDPLFEKHFVSGPQNSLYTSNRIQNDLIESINQVIKRQFKNTIANKNVSLIADETSDLGHHEQLSIVIRYYDSLKRCPYEQFICMKRMTQVNAQSIFDVLNDTICEYNIKWENLVSVCFDGASTMSGSTAGVQAKFKEKNPKLYFVHCYGHCLNLVLVDSIGKDNRVTFDFFGYIQLIYTFVEGSCMRHAVFEKIVNTTNVKLKTLKSISTTRWACRSEAVSAIKANYSSLLIAIDEITDSTNQADVRAKGLGILSHMKSFDFIFALELLDPILCLILKTSTCLQSSTINLLTAMQLVEALKNSLNSMRNNVSNFDTIYKNSVRFCDDQNIDIPVTRQRRISTKIDSSSHTQHYFTKEHEMRKVYYSTLDNMISALNIRFNQETIDIIKSVGMLLNLQISSDYMKILTDTFDLDSKVLKTEIDLLKHTDDIPNDGKINIDKWIKWLTEPYSGRETIYFNFFKALQIYMAIPVTSCTCERTFSKLSLVKTKLRSTMNQERLDGLLTMFIEQELAYNINVDEVIETFKTLTPIERRMEL
uniref:Zinc finger MYM-type protein 1 n=1 Tax=Schizaphis graminum TaxID=13262 RepID=A0A2S2NXT3_SCHGA